MIEAVFEEEEEEGGKIILYLGPPCSGKTSKLLEKIKKYKYKQSKTILIKYSTKPKNDDKIITHDLQEYKAISCNNLSFLMNKLMCYDVIGIDNGHLFPDLVEICDRLTSDNKRVFVTGVNGNEKMEPLPNISRLISKAYKIKLLHAFCFFCHEEALFSLKVKERRNKDNKNDSYSYRPVCRLCHFIHQNDKDIEQNDLIISNRIINDDVDKRNDGEKDNENEENDLELRIQDNKNNKYIAFYELINSP